MPDADALLAPPPDGPALPRLRPWRSWVAWGVLICVLVGAAEGLLTVLGTALLHTGTAPAAATAALQERMSLIDALGWRIFLGTAALRAEGLAAMLAIIALGQSWLPRRGAARWIGLLVLAAACTAAGWQLYQHGLCPVARGLGIEVRWARQCVLGGPPVSDWTPLLVVRQAQFAVLLVGLHEFAWRGRRAREALHDAELRGMRLDGELAAARAHLLQAQVEPHFLFNSLATVRRLIRTDGRAAAAMLSDLLRYLHEALPRLRKTDSTLAQEVELVRAYLDVHGVRMGARLRYEIALPEALAAAPVPPMLLLTLVENALKHGLQPLPEGGSIHVGARSDGTTLTLSVDDTGRGMGESLGHGTGLTNIRARLRALYGARAALTLHLNEPRGVRAAVMLPDDRLAARVAGGAA